MRPKGLTELNSNVADSADFCVGRDEELRRLADLADASADRPVVVLGPWGSGKSTVLRVLAETARARRVHIVHASAAARPLGEESSSVLAPYTDLRALLGQLSPTSLVPAPAAPVPGQSPLAAGMAAVRLLARTAEASTAGVLAVVDDADRVDRASAQALAVVCRRLRSVRAGLVLASRERTLAADLDVSAEEIVLGPLADHDAHLLLERRTSLRRSWLRRIVVAQAKGNPLALLDYARTAADGRPDERGHWPVHRPLPCSPKTLERLAAVLEQLPSVSRLALLVAASTSGEELAEVIAADPRNLTPGVWRTAEEAGLVVTSARGVEFTHPLIRSAVYHCARADERAMVHRGIAEALADLPERSAWHLAEALTPGSRDPELAAQLERGAGDTARRQGPEAAATALERAAELTHDDEDRARRLTQAAAQASLTGDPTWAQSLATRAAALTQDPRLHDFALVVAGSSMVWAGQYQPALALLLPLAQAKPPRDPRFAAAALWAAAMAASALGEQQHRAVVADAASRLAQDDDAVNAGTALAVVLALSMCAPFQDRDRRTARLRDLLSSGARAGLGSVARADPQLSGMSAWLLDESELAVEMLGRCFDSITHWTGRGSSGGVTVALASVCLDTGRWSRATSLAERVLATEMLDQADFSIVTAQSVLAFLAAYRGDTPAAARFAAEAESTTREWSDRAALAKARHAAGLAALIAGEDSAAYGLLSELLSYRGQGPLHHHQSYYAVADFARAAMRTGQRAQGTRVLRSALLRIDGSPSPRIELLIHHAKALLSTRDDAAEQHFLAALAPGSGQWPVEQARTTLHYAEWLRRRHREREAVPLLVSARRAFELVGARPGVSRVNEELRAARHSPALLGGTGPDLASAARAWSQLSGHQQHILRLAAQGHSNREIAAELSLSPRTIGSHLYRAYPPLGISSRYQIRDVLAALDVLRPQGPDQRS